jgi:hypothetical protein
MHLLRGYIYKYNIYVDTLSNLTTAPQDHIRSAHHLGSLTHRQ